MREDGLAAVLGALLGRSVAAAALIDLDSGMVLDACAAPSDPRAGSGSDGAGDHDAVDHDALGAAHAELVRAALGVVGAGLVGACVADDGAEPASAPDFELVLDCGDGSHHLVQWIPDPHGDRVVLSVVVAGSARTLKRVRRKLRAVSRSALTAGPTTRRRPGEHGWRLGLPEQRSPGPSAPSWAAGTSVPTASEQGDEGYARPAPPAALPPASGGV